MSTDPLLLLARQRIITASAELEVELRGIGSAPTLEILKRLRTRAEESMAALATVNLCDPAEIPKAITLQNEVKRYDEWLTWMREIVEEGIAADKAMRQEEREELVDYLAQSPEGKQQLVDLGLADPGMRDR